MPRILFAAWHLYLDQSNGASISTRELLLGLSRRGWDVETFCATGNDYSPQLGLEELFRAQRLSLKAPGTALDSERSLIPFKDEGIDSVVFRPKTASRIPTREDGRAFLAALERTVAVLKPDIYATYGGYWAGNQIVEIGRRGGAKVVAFLHNLLYSDKSYFQNVDLTIVPSSYARGVYSERLGIELAVVPPLIDLAKVVPDEADASSAPEPKCVLYVNPEVGKGAYWFAKIVEETGKRRPEIPFLVVKGRTGFGELVKSGVNWGVANNLRTIENTDLAREFYGASKVALVPSLAPESFGRIVAEAQSAGVPVVASNRGALPETVGDAGVVLPIPKRFVDAPGTVPSAEDVAPWVDEIVRLWDDPAYFAVRRAKGLARAREWETDAVLDRAETVLRQLLN